MSSRLLNKEGFASYAIALAIITVVALPAQGRQLFVNNPVLNKADSLVNSEKITEAETLYEGLVNEYCDSESRNVQVCVEANYGLISISQKNQNGERAESIAKEAETYLDRLDEYQSIYEARLYRFWLIHSDDKNDYTEAEKWADKLSGLLDRNSENPHLLAYIYTALGSYQDTKGNYNEAIELYEKGISYAEDIPYEDESVSLLLQATNNLGVAYKNLGMLEEAREQYSKSLEFINREYEGASNDKAIAFINIGSIYFSEGDVGQAAEYFFQASEVYRSLEGAYRDELGASLNNLAVAYYTLGNYQLAAEYFEESLLIKQETFGPNHSETAIGYANLASIYSLDGDFGKAMTNLERALEILTTVYGAEHPMLIDTHITMGDILSGDMGMYERARPHYDQALSITKNRLGNNHPDVTDINVKIGETYYNQGHFDRAEEHFDEAIRNEYGEFDLDQPMDVTRSISRPVLLVNALSRKAAVLRNKQESFNKSNAEKALSALEWASDLVDAVQITFKNESSKLLLKEKNYSIYTDAIELLAELYNQTDNEEYKNEIFEVVEKSRSRVTLELIQKVNAGKYAGVPADVISQERALDNKITNLQQKLYQEESKGFKKNGAMTSTLQDSLFYYKRQLEEFTGKLESDYPSYYHLKYDQSVISLEAAQRLLQDEEAAISYVIGEHSYAVVLTKNDLNIVDLGDLTTIEESVSELRKQVLNDEIDTYKESAFRLYEQLIKPVEEFVISDELLIMADQSLYYLPFELLLKEAPNHSRPEDFPYLLHEYTISYIPSMTLLREMDAIRDTNSKNLLALAPFSGEISETDRRMMSHRYSENSDQLFFTRYETEQISSTFNEGSVRASSLSSDQKTEILMGDEATTSRLMKTPLSDYDYIHFATHAFINEENPEFSAILLYPEEGNSGAKYVSDIYGLELDANLVVLGACQTGLGSIYKGEGIIGFTRAFIYAGTSNLATSLWKVNDQPTAYLMVDFYEQIRQGFSYSEALRRAKLKLIESPRFASPVNWAAFTLTGR